MNVQASLKVLPKGADRVSSYSLVDEALYIIKDSGLKYTIGVSETTVEGDLKAVLALVETIHEFYATKNIEFTFFIGTEYNLDNFYIDDKKVNISNVENN